MQTRNFVDTRSFLSETKFYDGYSRYIEDQSRYETWDEAVSRVINMHRNYYNKNGELEKYLEEAQTAYSEQRVLAAQRSLQFGGEQLLKHQMRMYNCTSSYADRPSFFGEFFYILLCGAGAGFSVQTHHIDKLPNIKIQLKVGHQLSMFYYHLILLVVENIQSLKEEEYSSTYHKYVRQVL